MDVIVGRALSTETPVFAEEMREVIFRPYWNVPRSILLRELLPRIERDPEYLAREDMEIVRGEGDNAAHVDLSPEALEALRRGALRVRQRPGPRNALGLVKFVFPNREDVYMHGTPAQALFARTRRDFSHGCVRVADPIALAEWVLRDRPEWTRDRIQAATMGARTVHVRLHRPITVILFYTTAAVMPEDGTLHFAEDIYRHDARLDRALADLHRLRTRPISGPADRPVPAAEVVPPFRALPPAGVSDAAARAARGRRARRRWYRNCVARPRPPHARRAHAAAPNREESKRCPSADTPSMWTRS